MDDTGPRLPVGCHLGDGLSAWVRDSARVIRDALDPIAAAGYQWVRVWWQLPDTGYWAGRGVGPFFTPDFSAQVQSFHAACRAREIQIHWASGDFAGYSTTQARESVEIMAQIVADDERAYGAIGCLWEGVNEAGGTTDGWGPSEIGALVRHAQTILDPSMLVTWSAYGGTEEKDVLTAWTPPANPFFYYHGYRGGFAPDKFRHPFSNVYESPVRRIGWSGEPFGLGPLVSAWENQGEMDDSEAMACFGAAHLLFRQAFCYMSSDGVKIQGSIDRWNGFREIPALARYLEAFAADLHRLPILTHVGDYKPERAWDLPDNDAGVRLDQAVGDRIAVGHLYGPAGSVRVQSLGPAETVVLHPATLAETVEGRSFTVPYRFGRVLLARW